MLLKFLNQQLEYIGSTDRIILLSTTQKLNDSGSFDAEIPYTADNCELVSPYNGISFDDFDGVILRRERKGNTLVFSGIDLNTLISRQVSEGETNHTTLDGALKRWLGGTYEESLSFLSSNPTSYYVFGKSGKLYNMLEVAKAFADEQHIIFNISFTSRANNVKRLLTISEPNDLRKIIVFRDNDGSITEFSAVEDYTEGVNGLNKIVTKDNGTDVIATYRLKNEDITVLNDYVVASSDNDTESLSDYDAQYNIKSARNIETSYTFVPSSKYKYGVDYNLGDYISLSIKPFEKRIYEVQQVVEVKKKYSGSNTDINITCGVAKDNELYYLYKRSKKRGF